jgi:hypothetical protein
MKTETDMSWMIEGTPIFYKISYPFDGKFSGTIDSPPKNIGLNGGPKSWAIRLRDLDDEYQRIFRTSVAACVPVALIERRMEE